MVWWKRFFKKKTEPVEEDDWEQVVYTRNGVNFEEEDQRKRYIVNCLEQITEASREIDLLTGEYTLVTSYLTDMEEIEALPAQQRGEINRTAGKISALEQERSKYREKKNRGLPHAVHVNNSPVSNAANIFFFILFTSQYQYILSLHHNCIIFEQWNLV